MRNIFKNVNLQAEYDKNGFVVIPMLEVNEVSILLNYYQNQEFDNKIEAGFHISLDNQNENLVKDVGAQIKSILVPKTTNLFFIPRRHFLN